VQMNWGRSGDDRNAFEKVERMKNLKPMIPSVMVVGSRVVLMDDRNKSLETNGGLFCWRVSRSSGRKEQL